MPQTAPQLQHPRVLLKEPGHGTDDELGVIIARHNNPPNLAIGPVAQFFQQNPVLNPETLFESKRDLGRVGWVVLLVVPVRVYQDLPRPTPSCYTPLRRPGEPPQSTCASPLQIKNMECNSADVVSGGGGGFGGVRG